MSPFTVLILCVQACLIQSVMSQCGCGSSYRPIYNTPSYVSSISSVPSISSITSCNYGGSGPGLVSAAGNIGATGDTQVAGSVPVLGDASFSGQAKAYGSVTISGQCGCGCS